MSTYHAYVGSTDTYDAWTANPNAKHVTGIWDGEQEHTAVIVLWRIGDLEAIQWASNMARDTGNDQVLVVRARSPLDHDMYRVERWGSTVGNRTRLGDGTGYRYVSTNAGPLTAWLVDAGGHITTV